MQILKHGNKANIVTCECGCEFLYSYEDIKSKKTSDSSGKEETYVICPECKKENLIGKK